MKFNNQSLKKAVKEWFSDKQKAKKTYGDITEWDTSEVTDMSDLFKGIKLINENLSKWNTDRVTDIRGMFKNTEIEYANIANWNVQNVISASEAFYDCHFGYLEPCLNWQLKNNVDDYNMFFETTRGVLKFYESSKHLLIPKKGKVSISAYDLSDQIWYLLDDPDEHFGFEHWLTGEWDGDDEPEIDWFWKTDIGNYELFAKGDDSDRILGEEGKDYYIISTGGGHGEIFHYKSDEILTEWKKWKSELKRLKSLEDLEIDPDMTCFRDLDIYSLL